MVSKINQEPHERKKVMKKECLIVVVLFGLMLMGSPHLLKADSVWFQNPVWLANKATLIPELSGTAWHTPGNTGVTFDTDARLSMTPLSYHNPFYIFQLETGYEQAQAANIFFSRPVVMHLVGKYIIPPRTFSATVFKVNPQETQTWSDCWDAGYGKTPPSCQMPKLLGRNEQTLELKLKWNWYGYIYSGEELQKFLQNNFQAGDYVTIMIGCDTKWNDKNGASYLLVHDPHLYFK
jgi:hypothetical protein